MAKAMPEQVEKHIDHRQQCILRKVQQKQTVEGRFECGAHQQSSQV
jgi:hypothetical protein